MAAYIVRIERWDSQDWRVQTPDTEIEDDEHTPSEIAAEIALLETVADGHRWRVRVWRGTSTATRPDAEEHIQRSP